MIGLNRNRADPGKEERIIMGSTFTVDDLKEKLQKSQHKLTPQRKIVLQVFMDHQGEHLSAEDVHDLLRDNRSDIGLATIYRSLELLRDIGIIDKMEFGDGCSRYELNLKDPDEHQHHHLICLKCGKVIEFSDDFLETLEKEIGKKTGFEVVDHQVKFYGYCKECQ